MHSNFNRGYLIALVSAVILSTTGILIRHLTETYQIPALVLAFWRDTFVGLCLWMILRGFRPSLLGLNRQQTTYVVLYGLVLAVFNSLWTLSVTMNGAAVATVLAYCSAGFTALLGRWLLKEHLGWGKVLAVIFSLGGCVLIVDALNPSAWNTNILGILTGTLSGLCYAIYSLMGRSAAQRGLSPWTTVLYTFSFAAVFLLMFNLFPGGYIPGAAVQPSDLFWLGKTLAGWGILILLAIGPTLLGFGLYNTSLSYLPSSIANLILTLEPVFTAIIAYFWLGERLTGLQIIGGLCILTGVVFLRLTETRVPASPE